MIQVVFFASLREDLGKAGLSMHGEDVGSVADVITRLVTDQPAWSEALRAANLLVAVNQEMVMPDHEVKDGDEVAFFPPVTGG